MRFQCLVAVAGVLLSVCQGSAQTASDSVGSPSASSLIVLLDSPASGYTVPILLDHPKADFSSCGKFSPTQVVLKLTVEKDGSARDVEVAGQSLSKCVGKAAQTAVRSYRFTSGQRDGRPEVTHIGLAVEAEEPVAINETAPPLPSGKVTAPVILKYVDPNFPKEKVAPNTAVTFRAAFVVDTDGSPKNVRIIDAPDGELAQIAENAVLQDRFWPAMKDGTAVKVDLTIEIHLYTYK